MTTISAAARERIEKALPEGITLDDVRVLECQAQIQTADALAPEELAVVADLKEAGPPLVNEDGKPTIMRVVAWMCHGDVPNKNRDAFVKEELQAAASALFRAPNFGVMDFNHSAVRGFSDDPKVIGVWYKAEYAFDQQASEGKGAWGLLATGMMFAWAFPEYANALLGEQARSGFVPFSMACIPGGVEYRTDEDGGYAVLHNPVFFTNSALDVTPADTDARGKATEDATVTDQDLQAQVAEQKPVVAAQEGEMDEEVRKQLEQERADALAQAEGLATKVTEQEALLAAERAKVLGLEARVAELETVRDGLVNEVAAAAAKVTALEAEKAALEAKVAEYEAAQAAAAQVKRLADRLAALPAELRAAHEKKDADVRARVEARWTAMSDADWEVYLNEELLLGFNGKVGFVARSLAEGQLLTGADQDDEFGIDSRLLRLIKR